jgi:SH3-like domain-containing protein
MARLVLRALPVLGAWALALILAGPASAQATAEEAVPSEAEIAAITAAQPIRGPVTNLPLPRFVSLKTSEGNARRGPSLSHRIDWVFRHNALPLRVTAEYGHWRRVEDRDGAGGWVHYSLLSGVRTVIVQVEAADLRSRPEPQAPILARAEFGVIARLGDCALAWCRITAGGTRGWVAKSEIWGVEPEELRD